MRTEGLGRALGALVAVAALALGSGCAGARTTVVADHAQYPISLSGATRDANGTIVGGDEELEKVGSLREDATAWGMLYSAIRLNPRTDVSRAVNEQVAKAGGEAVVNLKVRGGHCASDFFAIIDVIPIWPGCTKVVVEGDIVRVRRRTAAPVARSGSTTPSRLASAELEAVR